MRDFFLKKCIYCCDDLILGGNASEEDIVPRFLGGFIRPKIACKRCNEIYGHDIDSKWLKNNEVVAALAAFGMPVNPRVYKDVQSSAPRSESGMPLYELDGYGKTKAPFFISDDKGTLHFDRQHRNDWVKAESAITGIIKKQYGLDDAKAANAVRKIKDAFDVMDEEGTKTVEVIEGNFKITFKMTTGITENEVNMLDHFSSGIAAPCVVKMAYAILACCIGEHIFDPTYENVRRFLRGEDGHQVRAFSFTGDVSYRNQYHAVSIRVRKGRLFLGLLLFGHIGFVVEMGVGVGNYEDFDFLFNLKEKELEPCHLSPESEESLEKALDEFIQDHPLEPNITKVG